jgi:hypothetical protein
MTELEMSLTLGIKVEPDKNVVKMDPLLQSEIIYLKYIFLIAKRQADEVGRANSELWNTLLPWNSAN